MATGTFTYNALRTKTLKECIKTQRNIVSPSNSRRTMLLGVGMTAIEPHLSICLVGFKFSSQGFVVKRTAAIFFLTVDCCSFERFFRLNILE